MIAIYYAIYEYNESSQRRGEIVEEGIVSNSEETICPRQTTGIEELPFECELHHFKANGYRIEICNFTITREFVIKNRTNGDKIQ